MYTIQHNPAWPYNCDETAITIVLRKNTKILGLTGERQISSIQPHIGNLLWQSSTVWVQLDTSFLRCLYFPENIRNK